MMHSSDTIEPNQTLYLSNLPSKPSKNELKKLIYQLMTPFGRIHQIIATKTMKPERTGDPKEGRGQAFVVMEDVKCASECKRVLQGFIFMDKKMNIQYAKTKSKIIEDYENEIQGQSKSIGEDTKKSRPMEDEVEDNEKQAKRQKIE